MAWELTTEARNELAVKSTDLSQIKAFSCSQRQFARKEPTEWLETKTHLWVTGALLNLETLSVCSSLSRHCEKDCENRALIIRPSIGKRP